MDAKKVYFERRIICPDDLRNYCIKNQFYTKGDCASYEKLLGMCKKFHFSTNDLVEMAEDILSHSVVEESYDLSCLLYDLCEISHTIFEEISMY